MSLLLEIVQPTARRISKGKVNLLFRNFSRALAFSAAFLLVAGCLASSKAQSSATPTPVTPVPATQVPANPDAPSQQAPSQAEPPKGTVLFQSHGEPPLPGATEVAPLTVADPKANGPELTDAERSAITVTGYDLDARLTPSSSRLSMRAKLTLRNDGSEPLHRVALQISSTLQWESASLVAPGGSTKLELGQHLLDTDADHTGQANEAVLLLPAPLAPGQSLTLNTFYSGTIAQSGGRLERIGAAADQSLAADWDGIFPGHTALRGFGNVLWYPVASPQLFLGNGAELFQAIGQTELRESGATVRLRVGVEYTGDPPTAVYFCGRREALKAVSDSPDAPTELGAGIAVAEFASEPLGFRLPSLVVLDRPEQLIAPLPAAPISSDQPAFSSSTSASTPSPVPDVQPDASTAAQGAPMLAVETSDEGALPALENSAERVAPLLQAWLGEKPLSALTVVDHAGQPFEDGPLLLAPVSGLAVSTALPALAHSLTHAWVQTGRPWMDEGLAQFFALLWTERESGRDAALLQLSNLLQPLAIAEPELEQGKPAPAGQPLITATSEIFFRRKSAAVWFMLRGIAGEKPLQAALHAWRLRPPSSTTAEQDALAFEALLEKTSGKDLHWFFDDWVLHDRGLPDLSIADVTPRQLPAGNGHGSTWLVSVTVHNDSGVAAEVPVIVRSGTFSTTTPLRIPAFSNATARVLAESAPTEVQVNDGSTPEVSVAQHIRTVLEAKPAGS